MELFYFNNVAVFMQPLGFEDGVNQISTYILNQDETGDPHVLGRWELVAGESIPTASPAWDNLWWRVDIIDAIAKMEYGVYISINDIDDDELFAIRREYKDQWWISEPSADDAEYPNKYKAIGAVNKLMNSLTDSVVSWSIKDLEPRS